MDWERFLKRLFGVIIIVILLGFAFNAHSAESTEAGAGTQNWQHFLIHVRQGEVDAAVIGGKCLGKDTDGSVRTVGCARWKEATGWLDGECWITVREWGSSFLAIVLQNWGHELGHCVKGKWHE